MYVYRYTGVHNLFINIVIKHNDPKDRVYIVYCTINNRMYWTKQTSKLKLIATNVLTLIESFSE